MDRYPNDTDEDTTSSDDSSEFELETPQFFCASSSRSQTFPNGSHRPRNSNQRFHEAKGQGLQSNKVHQEKLMSYKIGGQKHTFLRQGDTHILKITPAKPKPKYENYSKPSTPDLVRALEKCEAMMKEDAARELRARQEAENKASAKEDVQASSAGNIGNLPRYSPPSSSRQCEEFENSAAALPNVSDLEPEIATADSSTRNPLDDFVSPPRQERNNSREGGLYIRSYRIPNNRKISTEEITLPDKEVMDTLDLDRNSNNNVVIQDLPNITAEKIAMALSKAKEEFYKELLSGQNNASASGSVPQRAMGKKDDKKEVGKGPKKNEVASGTTSKGRIMKKRREKKNAKEANQWEKNDEDENDDEEESYSD